MKGCTMSYEMAIKVLSSDSATKAEVEEALEVIGA